ncbi:MAG TPA: TIGR03621 family F420-dependent LLM class oxidoreductase, partial [Acidimicrobiia bacterium]|nr:TIGR03621 family F420-dependent LLM class oxidoreductase [Acidimicrobiia bacterium]
MPDRRARQVRFAFAWGAVGSLADLESAARRAEGLGYDVLLVPDHLGDQLAPLLALLAVARSTSHLRVATMVLDNDFRHPAVLAKELATLDVLTEGRLEVGIGAGWFADEYRSAGIPFEAAATRVSRLGETLQVLRALFDGGPVTHHGAHLRLDGFELRPRPHQVGGPPILVGGGGERVLRLAGRCADIVNITHVGGGLDGMDPTELTLAAFQRKVAIVRDAASSRGHVPEIGTNLLGVSITDDR